MYDDFWAKATTLIVPRKYSKNKCFIPSCFLLQDKGKYNIAQKKIFRKIYFVDVLWSYLSAIFTVEIIADTP